MQRSERVTTHKTMTRERKRPKEANTSPRTTRPPKAASRNGPTLTNDILRILACRQAPATSKTKNPCRDCALLPQQGCTVQRLQNKTQGKSAATPSPPAIMISGRKGSYSWVFFSSDKVIFLLKSGFICFEWF